METTRLSSGSRKSDLPAECRAFLDDMQRLNFGRYENILVCGGQPCLTPKPRRIREIKPGGENAARPEGQLDDFLLKDQVIDFFRHLQAMGNGTILVLEVKHELPFRMQIEEDAA